MWPFGLQKAANDAVKDSLSQADMPCFATSGTLCPNALTNVKNFKDGLSISYFRALPYLSDRRAR